MNNPPASLRDGMTALVNIYPAQTPLVQATGSVQYANEWQVTAPQGGTVSNLTVQPGGNVTLDQTVATLSGPTLDSVVQKAQQAVQ